MVFDGTSLISPGASPADGRGELSLPAPRSRAGIENGNLVVSLARRRSDLSFYFPERGNSPPSPLPSASAESSSAESSRCDACDSCDSCDACELHPW